MKYDFLFKFNKGILEAKMHGDSGTKVKELRPMDEKNGIVELPVWGRMPDDQVPETTYEGDGQSLFRHVGIQMGEGEDKFMSGIECHEDVRGTGRKAFTEVDEEFESAMDTLNLKK